MAIEIHMLSASDVSGSCFVVREGWEPAANGRRRASPSGWRCRRWACWTVPVKAGSQSSASRSPSFFLSVFAGGRPKPTSAEASPDSAKERCGCVDHLTDAHTLTQTLTLTLTHADVQLHYFQYPELYGDEVFKHQPYRKSPYLIDTATGLELYEARTMLKCESAHAHAHAPALPSGRRIGMPR